MQFQGLTDKQTQDLFTLSEICGIELTAARLLLQRSDFNLEQATQLHFNPAPLAPNPPPIPQQPHYIPPQNQYIDQPYYQNDFDQNEDPSYSRYRNYRFSGTTFQTKYPLPSNGIKGVFSWISNKFKGETSPGEKFRDKLDEIFPKTNKINFLKGTFLEAMHHVRKEKFPLVVLTHNFQKQHRDLLKNLISNTLMADFLNTTFRTIGFDLPDYQADEFLTSKIDRKNIPCISIFKIDECQEIVLMDIIELLPSTDFKELRKRINSSKSKYIKDEIKESEYGKRFTNELNGNYDSNPMTFQRRLELQEERRLKEIQQKQHREQNKQLMEKKKQQEKEKQLEQEKQLEGVRKVEQRKVNREKLVVYKEGIRVRLRLPNGNQLVVVVPEEVKVEYLFEYVECQEEVGFEEDVERKFDIIRPYDRLTLGEKRGMSLKEVFGETDSQSLVVNELA